ncbi:hypothetical protein D3C75_998060 [compost metagenome]
MLTFLVALQRALHLLNEQHVVHALTAVTRLSADLLTIGNIVGHRVAVEPYLALHRVEVSAKAQLAQHREDVLLFKRPLRVVACPTLTHKHAAQGEFGGGIARVSAEGDQVFLLRQLRRGITPVAQHTHMIPARRFTNDKHHVGIIEIGRRLVGKFFGRIHQRFVIR